MAADRRTLAKVAELETYEHGFITDIEQEFAPKGLSADTVRYISAQKREPEWMLAWRLEAFERWQALEEPNWARVSHAKIDYQDSYYYAAPKEKIGPASLDEVDPELLAVYAKLGIPLKEQEVLAGVAPLISAAGVAAGYLTAAAGILAVEAYHAGYIRTTLTGRAIAAGSAAAYPYLGAANLVEDLRATLTVGASAAPSTSGSVETALTLPTSLTTPSSIVAASAADAVGFARTVNQVLHIVYGSPTVGVNTGGFFPTGMNSIFATTTA